MKSKLIMFLKRFDLLLLALTILACLFGIVMIDSAASSYDNPERYTNTQIVSLCIGLCAMSAVFIIHYESIACCSHILFMLAVFLLLAVFVPGLDNGLRQDMGSYRWIRYGGFGFQPSEIIKIIFIITFAQHLSQVDKDISKLKNLILLSLHTFVIIGLVLIEPDAGAALTFFVIALAMLFVTGLHWKYFAWLATCFVAFMPVAWIWILKDYQKLRIYNFLHPEADPINSGYQVLQSKIVIGAGMILGRGFRKGTTQLGFLPERHNDFIFSVIGEELGLIGCIATLIILISIVLRSLHIAKSAKNSLGLYMATGISAMFAFQIFENIGMCIGLMPVTGITLPFISYGGSSLIANLITVGLLLNINHRCRTINF